MGMHYIENDWRKPIQTMEVGDKITALGKLVDAQVKEGKSGKMLLLTGEVTYTNQKGELVARERVNIFKY